MRSIYESRQWLEDLDSVLADLPILSQLDGRSVLITGAGGLICSALTDLLIRYNETHERQICIFAAGRDRDKLLRRFYPYSARPYFTIVEYDAVAGGNRFPGHCDFIIHGAGNASPGRIIAQPVETMTGNFAGLYELLEYARDVGTASVLYISSSEVYGKKNDDRPFSENEYGYVDLLDPRSSYAVAKRAAETLCTSYTAQFGVRTVIVRPGHIYGPTASETDDRVSSAWARSAAKGEGFVMKSDGAQKRSYCYCLDCAAAIVTALLKGASGKAYNISNPDSVITIREMGSFLAGHAGVDMRVEVATDQEKRAFNPMPNSSLDSSGMISLGWHGIFDAPTGLAHTVDILKEII